MPKSIEEKVEDLIKTQLNNFKVKYFTKTEAINTSIDDALKNYGSKSGGSGSNYPDLKILLKSLTNRMIPVMVEVKGTKNKLIKYAKNGTDIELVTTKKDGTQSFSSIQNFAVNGAVHYANAILDLTDYQEVIAIGINGYLNPDQSIFIEFKAFYISKNNNKVPKEIKVYKDLSFLKQSNINQLYDNLDLLHLTEEEIEKETQKLEAELETRIHKIHQSLYDDSILRTELSTNDKLYVFCGLIMASLPINGVSDLELSDLKGDNLIDKNDGIVLLDRVKLFLKQRAKDNQLKSDLIISTLESVFKNSTLYNPNNKESYFKKLFKQIKEEIVPYLNSKYHLDFTGKIFNKLSDWVSIDNDIKNDVVLTPRYITKLMTKLTRVNRDSFVLDSAMGSAGFLVTAMEEMIRDAKGHIQDKDTLEAKIQNIKSKQILGVEVLQNIYILAVLNMILMGDGSSNLHRADSLAENIADNFPATIFLLNPPYSARGKGFIFVEKALKHMIRGYACVLIQENAGSGQGLPYTKQILENNTLIASIKMADLFKGKASVQTAIYLFEVNKPHDKDYLVTFIDFSNDGYKRQSRKKSNQDVNLQDVDHAKERYQEIVDIVLGRKPKTSFYTEKNGLVIKDTISLEGNDWTFKQHKKYDLLPSIDDFKKTVSEFLDYKVSLLEDEDKLKKITNPRLIMLEDNFKKMGGKFEYVKNKFLFDIKSNPQLNKSSFKFTNTGKYPYFTRTLFNNGILGYVDYLDDEHKIKGNSIAIGMMGMKFFYMKNDFYAGQFTKTLYPKFSNFNEKIAMYFISLLNKLSAKLKSVLVRDFDNVFYDSSILLPFVNNEISFEFMEDYIQEIQELYLDDLEDIHNKKFQNYLKIIRQNDHND